jgi:hypothetical protein
MPSTNHFKFGASAISSATRSGFKVGVKGGADYGPTSTNGFYNGITPPVSGYTIYVDKASQGPSIHVASDNNQCIFFLKSFGSTGSTISDVLAWAGGQSNIHVATSELTLGDLPGGGGNAGEYYLLIGAGGYNPALADGTITFPKHAPTNLGLADPNLILSEASLYINFIDALNVDRTTILTSMTTNSGTIRLSQAQSHIEFSFTSGAFRIHNQYPDDVSVYWDDKVGVPPTGTLSLVSTSGTVFNDSYPITITINI